MGIRGEGHENSRKSRSPQNLWVVLRMMLGWIITGEDHKRPNANPGTRKSKSNKAPPLGLISQRCKKQKEAWPIEYNSVFVWLELKNKTTVTHKFFSGF